MGRDELTLDIDPVGRIQASPAVAQLLAASAGRWRVVPSVANLLILQRDAENDFDPAVTLCGAIDSQGGLSNVFNFIHFSQLDGVMDVVSGRLRRTLHFRKGQLLAATSNLPEDRLGALLVRFGLIN